MSNIITEWRVCEEIVQEYNILNILNELINKYFFTNFLDMEAIVENKDKDMFASIINMMTEMLWLTNNFISHSS